jgi:hypothetical protein
MQLNEVSGTKKFVCCLSVAPLLLVLVSVSFFVLFCHVVTISQMFLNAVSSVDGSVQFLHSKF